MLSFVPIKTRGKELTSKLISKEFTQTKLWEEMQTIIFVVVEIVVFLIVLTIHYCNKMGQKQHKRDVYRIMEVPILL